MKIAFDIDDTIWKCTLQYSEEKQRQIMVQVPDYQLIQVLLWFYGNGDEVFVWSAGGVDYAKTVVSRLGLHEYVKVIEKGSIRPDIAFDDKTTDLANVDIKVKREVLPGVFK